MPFLLKWLRSYLCLKIRYASPDNTDYQSFLVAFLSNMAAVVVMLMGKTAERAGEFAGSTIPTWPLVHNASPGDCN